LPAVTGLAPRLNICQAEKLAWTSPLKGTGHPSQDVIIEATLGFWVFHVEDLELVIGKQGLLIEDLVTDVAGNDKPVILLAFIGHLLGDFSGCDILRFLVKEVLDGFLQHIMGTVDFKTGLLIGRDKDLTVAIIGFTLVESGGWRDTRWRNQNGGYGRSEKYSAAGAREGKQEQGKQEIAHGD
jgi:hypothetical protein